MIAILGLLGCGSLVDLFGGGEPTDDSTPTPIAGDSGDTGEADPTDEELAEDDAQVRALTDIVEGDYPCRDPMLVRVTWVDDGDTMQVYPEDGSGDFKVRFLGIDTPEVEHEDSAEECFGSEASAFTSTELLDRLVWLGFDIECSDDYGRSLAYLTRGEGEAGFVNRLIVRNGYGYAYPFNPNTTYESELQADEDAARDEGLGLWGDCN